MSSDAPIDAAPPAGRNGNMAVWLQSLWQWMVRHPFISVALILAIQTIPTIWARDLRPVDELRHAAVLMEMMENGNWLALHLNGEFYPDKPPIYFWFVAVFVWIFQTNSPPIFFLFTAFSGGLFLMATYQMARLIGKGSREFALIACMLLVTNVFFIERSHYPRMDLLFCTFIALSSTAFFVALEQHRSMKWMLSGFGFATLAALTKGPFGYATPLLTSIVFLAMTRNLSRLLSLEVLVGLVLSAAVMALYFFGLYLAEGERFLQDIFGYVDDKAGWEFGFNFGLDDYAYFLVSRWLPWTLLLFFMPWKQILAALAPSQWRIQDNARWIYLGLTILCTLVPLSIIDYVHPNFLIIILPALTVLSTAVITRLSATSLQWFVTVVALILLILGIGFPIITAVDESVFLVPYGFSSGIIAVVAAIGMLLMRREGFTPFVLVLAAGTTVISLLHFIVTNPTSDWYKSTKPASLVIAEFIDQGYEPFSFGYPGFGGFFQYYSGHRLPEYYEWENLNEELKQHDKAVIVSSRRAWEIWPDRPPEARIVHESPKNPSFDDYDRMSNDPYVFVVEMK